MVLFRNYSFTLLSFSYQTCIMQLSTSPIEQVVDAHKAKLFKVVEERKLKTKLRENSASNRRPCLLNQSRRHLAILDNIGRTSPKRYNNPPIHPPTVGQPQITEVLTFRSIQESFRSQSTNINQSLLVSAVGMTIHGSSAHVETRLRYSTSL